MLIIGITGQFCAGKSTVAKILSRRLKAEIVDADKIGHSVLLDKNIKKELAGHFGKDIIKNGVVNRYALAEKAFANAKNHKALCRITHPLLVEEIKDRLKIIKSKNPDSVVIIDAAVLIEMGLWKYVDRLIAVKANRKAQIMRAKSKWDLSEKDINRRIKLQIPFSRLAKKAGFIIDNSGGLQDLKSQIKMTSLNSEGVWKTNG